MNERSPRGYSHRHEITRDSEHQTPKSAMRQDNKRMTDSSLEKDAETSSLTPEVIILERPNNLSTTLKNPTTTTVTQNPPTTATINNVEHDTPRPYSSITESQRKYLLTPLLGLATTTSPLTATIYFPLLPLLRTRFGVSTQSINLTLTIYIVFQAISPAIFGPLSDTLGRRPIYLLTFSMFCAANLGLALLTSSTRADGSNGSKGKFAALLILRALQSLGASAAQSVSYGVVADVCTSAERGGMIGPMSMILTLATVVGPLMGGIIAWGSGGGVVWVFWALVVVGFVLLVGVWALLPETARGAVGDGNVDNCLGDGEGGKEVRRYWWERSGLEIIRKRRTKKMGLGLVEEQTQNQTTRDERVTRPSLKERIRVGNPLVCLKVLLHKDTILILWMHSSFYVVDYAMVAVLPDIYRSNYHFNELQIGLSYLPRGLGIVIGGYVVGRMMDHNYNYIAANRQVESPTSTTTTTTTAKSTHDKSNIEDFPIERARSRGTFVLLLVSTATLIGYGWATQIKNVHVAVPLILQFSQGFWGTNFYTTYQTLLVDVFPESPSTAAGAASILRCAMAASGVAILQPLLESIGRGWYFTALGFWSGSFGAASVVLLRWKGTKWRQDRLKKMKARNDARKERMQKQSVETGINCSKSVD